ncbi:MAG: GNAT family N-acetyltransferase [Draconibacterium sp.]
MKRKLQKIEIEKYLNDLDQNFIPQLSTLVNIQDYSNKLAEHAEHFCLYHNNSLIGFVAMYCNNDESKIAFISSVSIRPDYTGKGLAKNLLGEALQYAKKKKFQKIQLEVGVNNKSAIGLYKSLGFEIENSDDKVNLMTLKI